MIILGIANGGTSGACLIKGSNIIAAASEERFSRIKMDNSWPKNSINFVLGAGKTNLNKIDYITYGWSAGFNAQDQLLNYFDRIVYEFKNNPSGIKLFRDRIEVELKRDKIKAQEFAKFIKENKISNKAYFINHHKSHAWSAISCSNYKSSLVVTADGRGDFDSLTISTFKNKKLKTLYRATSNDSLGTFYARISKLLGFTPHKHEGKITGLSALGNPRKCINLMKKMIKYKNGNIYGINGDYFKSFHNDHGRYKAWSKISLKKLRKFTREDVAASAQKHLETIMLKIINFYLKKTKHKNICLAGGVFANVLLNQKVKELKNIKKIFIQPHMGDGGLALGSAAALLFFKKKKLLNFKNMYLGPKYNLSASMINMLSKKLNVNFKKIRNIPKLVVQELLNNKIVGLSHGRMEFGPRALCNRSILYHANDKNINVSLNKRLNREEFMPFAPVTSEKLANKCYQRWNKNQVSARFMTLTYNCTNQMKKNCPAVVHVDGTARPQIVTKRDHPLMNKILMKWYYKTKGLSLLNTSFNHHEEPIVCSPEDAIRSYLRNNVDTLIINNFLVTKKYN
jgi:carbamoyltransferase